MAISALAFKNLSDRSVELSLNLNDLERLQQGRHHDPFAVLGLHSVGGQSRLLVLRPSAESLAVQTRAGFVPLTRIDSTDFFFWRGDGETLAETILLQEQGKDGVQRDFLDPYCFAPVLDAAELGRFGRESHWHAHRLFGAHCLTHQGAEGVLFSVWAPNAERVSVVGDFNQWDGRAHPMRCRGDSGIWELFLPGFKPGDNYKYEVRNRDSGHVFLKADPFGNYFEQRPANASRVAAPTAHRWDDEQWMGEREQRDWLHAPMSIYEVHLGSWRRSDEDGFLNYRELAHALVDYVRERGFTHIELLPITEHPFDGSWGYQATGFFAPTSRFGTPDDFRYFVDHCHRNNIGVLLDWVPAHFPKDAHGLARFDGSALYEHEHPARGEHRDWGTLIFNYGRQEVVNFLLSSAFYWLEEFHIDGLRVDAVASMLYLDYSREEGDWIPNQYGGNENLEAIEFLRTLNCVLHEHHPGALVMAEESTSWPQVSRPVYLGGLGFSMKWNMGWMNDTLAYFEKEPVFRQYHHEHLTFGLLYAYTENFVLPFSHDEVVHGKRSMLEKMPGDPWQQFANLRLLYSYLFCYPGKKLLFMGNEFAQGREWSHERSLDWQLLENDWQRGMQTLVSDLNRLYREEPALHRFDFEEAGFEWIDCHDSTQSVISFIRKAGDDYVVGVFNYTPVVRHNYRIGVPEPGVYAEVLNSDSTYYGGSNVSNGTAIEAEPIPMMNRPHSIVITLPPLAGVYFKRTSSN